MATEYLDLTCATFDGYELEVAAGSAVVQLNITFGPDHYHKFHIDPAGSDPERRCAAIMQAAQQMRDWGLPKEDEDA